MPQLAFKQKATHYAEQLRTRATPAERAMCRLLDAQMISYVFQAPVSRTKSRTLYIADFRIRRAPQVRPAGLTRKDWRGDTRKLFVEIDGSFHDDRQDYDARRTHWFETHRNAVVLRFSNEDVLQHSDAVLAAIMKFGPAIRTRRLSATSCA